MIPSMTQLAIFSGMPASANCESTSSRMLVKAASDVSAGQRVPGRRRRQVDQVADDGVLDAGAATQERGVPVSLVGQQDR